MNVDGERSIERLEAAQSGGHMHWEIADWCNYACSYCCEGRFAPKRVTNRYIQQERIANVERFLAGLTGVWTVRLSSGEPSAHPGLFDIVKMIRRTGHRVAMETNLSLALGRYEKFIEIAGDRLGYLHASLHLEEAVLGDFLTKCLVLRRSIEKISGAGIWIASVAVPDRLDQWRSAADLFERNGLQITPQQYFAPKHARKEASFSALREGSPRGHACFAGKRWLVLDINGDVWRCHSDRSDPAKILGNVACDKVPLLEGPEPCAYDVCHCPGRPVRES